MAQTSTDDLVLPAMARQALALVAADPDLGMADVFAPTRLPPRVTAGVLMAAAAAQVASFRTTSTAP